MLKQWKIKVDAHAAIVLALQAIHGVSKETLEALTAYESVSGEYSEPRGFSSKLKEAYASAKYGVDKLSTGVVPEELKAQHDWNHRLFARFDYDQWFRAITFGTARTEWEVNAEQREKERSEHVAAFKISGQWATYSAELFTLGMTPDISYERAKKIFRIGVKERRDAFGVQVSPEATRDVANFISAWREVEPLYKAKELNN